MNTLSYGLLALISTQPMTGYDLTIKLNRFWRSTHSAIYPLLSELMTKGYIECTNEKQSGKPDKKIYTLTDSGKDITKEWFLSETSNEVIRDEAALKMYCINCMDKDTAFRFFHEFEVRYLKKIEDYEKALVNLRTAPLSQKEHSFGGYILTQRALAKARLDLDWCHWAEKLYDNKDTDFLENNFN